jgi:4-hydroxybenzoate polyprenyltransferase
MPSPGHFFKLIRWPNLVFVAITQILFHFSVVLTSAHSDVWQFPLQLKQHLFWILVVASLLITAAGYIINDYFDINIDEVNKPGDMVVDRHISRRTAIVLHSSFSLLGLLLSAYVGYKLENPFVPAGNLVCIALLWLYSTTYKRRMIVGNVIISLMTAWVIGVMLVAEIPFWWKATELDTREQLTMARLWRIGALYASFAFVISLVREVIKDIEDMEGDKKDGCRTLPIVYGIDAARVFAGTWLLILIVALLATQLYVMFFGWWYSIAYILLLVVAPCIRLFSLLFKAASKEEFHILSSRLKWVMLAGIMSMIFFHWYTS